MSKKDQKSTIPIDKPKRKQLLASDTTIEALISIHNESKNAIGVFKDELDGWFKEINTVKVQTNNNGCLFGQMKVLLLIDCQGMICILVHHLFQYLEAFNLKY